MDTYLYLGTFKTLIQSSETTQSNKIKNIVKIQSIPIIYQTGRLNKETS